MSGLESQNSMNGVYISTYGCQMNVNDTERMYSLLEMANYAPVTSPDQASLIIINSCSVREKPVHKVHSEVGRYHKYKLKNPNLRIGVGGCVAQQEKKQLIEDIPLLDFVFGTDSIDKLPKILFDLEVNYAKRDLEPKSKKNKSHLIKSKIVEAKFEHTKPYQIETLIRNPKVSTFVNITKGCDNFCTFCVVPFTRGRERSRSLSELLDDVNKLVDRGVKEVTLLGQNVNSYKSPCGTGFDQLLKNLACKTGLERIRYTTSHPKDFNQELMNVMAEYSDKICEHIHLPVQSGNSKILDRMNRGYTREEYFDKVKMIRKTLPQAVLSTDIIVGFPGETRDQFLDTMSLIDEVGFESLYAYKYSPRPFTKAARFTDQVTEEEKSRHLNELFDFHKPQAREMAQTYLGKVLPVLVEGYKKESSLCTGRSPENKSVSFVGTEELVGQTCSIRITEAYPQHFKGENSCD